MSSANLFPVEVSITHIFLLYPNERLVSNISLISEKYRLVEIVRLDCRCRRKGARVSLEIESE